MKNLEETKYARMIRLGEWLQTFFNYDITAWDLLKLKDDAIHLLTAEYKIQVDYQAKDDEISTIVFRNLEENKYVPVPLMNHLEQLISYSMYELNEQKGMYNHIEKNRIQGTKDFDLWVEKQGQWIELFRDHFVYFFSILLARWDSLDVLAALSQSPTPWYLAFPSMLKSKSRKKNGAENGIRLLINSYDCTREKYVVQGDILVKVLNFYKPPNYENVLIDAFSWMEEYKSTMKEIHPPFDKAFPWISVLSRILFDFLELGGQYYSGVCERCGKFFIVQRKGRKQYCSDICRVKASQRRRKEVPSKDIK